MESKSKKNSVSICSSGIPFCLQSSLKAKQININSPSQMSKFPKMLNMFFSNDYLYSVEMVL